MITFEKLMDLYLDDNKSIVLPGVVVNNLTSDNEDIKNIEKSNNNTEIMLDSTGIFSDDKLVSYIDNEESIYLNYIKGIINSSLITCDCDLGKYFTASIENVKSDVKFDKKGKKMVISIKAEAAVNELNCNINIEKESGMLEIEKMINENLSNNIGDFVSKIQNVYNIDIFNFLDVIYKSDYSYYKEIKDNYYKDLFKDMEVDVVCDIKVIKKGNVLRDTYDE